MQKLLKTGLMVGILSIGAASLASAQSNSTQQLVAYLDAIPTVMASQDLSLQQARQLNLVLVSLSNSSTITPEEAAQYVSQIQSVLPSNVAVQTPTLTEDAYGQSLWFVPSSTYADDLKSAINSVQGVIAELIPDKS